MWKHLIIILIFLASMVCAGYYLYTYDKQNSLHNNSISESQTDVDKIEEAKETQIPIYLTEDFWKSVTPHELENQLKNISNVNELRPDNKKSMLHLLVEYGAYPEMVPRLISAGLDYNLKDEVENPNGESVPRPALFHAIIRKEQAYEFALPLIEYIEVNSYLNIATPLILAAYFRRPKIVSALLKKGADPNLKSKGFQSNSLISASVTNVFTNNSYIDPNTIQLLLDYNADITAKNKEGKNAFDYMKENEEFKKTELFKKLSEQFSQ